MNGDGLLELSNDILSSFKGQWLIWGARDRLPYGIDLTDLVVKSPEAFV
jgi:hypothetical protein